MLGFASALVSMTAAVVAAAEPHDLTLSSMTTHDGRRVSEDDLEGDYLTIVRELGIAVANKHSAPASTLGAYGFEVVSDTTFSFISGVSDDAPSPWERADPNETPARALVIPGLAVRKGLPMSTELGVRGGWVARSRQGTFGVTGRLGLVENYKPWPDVSVQVGYAGYVGNDELELGVWDFGMSIGSSFAFGAIEGVNTAHFAPWLSFSTLRVAAHPLLEAEIAEAVGAVPLTSRNIDAAHDEAMVVPQLGTGFSVDNGTFLFRAAGTWAPGSTGSVTVGLGFVY